MDRCNSPNNYVILFKLRNEQNAVAFSPCGFFFLKKKCLVMGVFVLSAVGLCSCFCKFVVNTILENERIGTKFPFPSQKLEVS